MVGPDSEHDCAFIAGDGEYAIEVVSGSVHQDRLEWLAQGRSENPTEYTCTALLVLDPEVDANAISVSINGVRVGHLPSDVGADLAAAMQTWGLDRVTCDALIEGGWYRNAEDKSDFRVLLDLNPDAPPKIEPAPVAYPVPVGSTALIVVEPKTAGTARDLAFGAIATAAMLLIIGMVWLLVPWAKELNIAVSTPEQTSGANERHETAIPTRETAPKKIDTATLAGRDTAESLRAQEQHAVPGPRRNVKALAATSDRPAQRASEPTSRADAHDVGPAVAIAESPKDAAAAASPKPITALSALAVGVTSVDAVRAGPAPRSTGLLPERVARAVTDEQRLAVANVPPTAAEEIRPRLADKQPAAAMTARSAEEIDPNSVPVSQPAPPPLPQPAPAEVRGNGNSGAAGRAGRNEGPRAPNERPKAERRHRATSDSRASQIAARSRALSRATRVRARSREPERYSTRRRRPVYYRVEPTPAPSAPAVATRPPTGSMAEQMIHGWAREWQHAVPTGRRPQY